MILLFERRAHASGFSLGTDKEGYKAHMKKKMNRSNWENSLVLYKQKELEGDRIGIGYRLYL